MIGDDRTELQQARDRAEHLHYFKCPLYSGPFTVKTGPLCRGGKHCKYIGPLLPPSRRKKVAR